MHWEPSTCIGTAGQQQRIPDSLVMGDDLAAEAEAVGETRIWNRLQGLAAEFSRAYDGMSQTACLSCGAHAES